MLEFPTFICKWWSVPFKPKPPFNGLHNMEGIMMRMRYDFHCVHIWKAWPSHPVIMFCSVWSGEVAMIGWPKSCISLMSPASSDGDTTWGEASNASIAAGDEVSTTPKWATFMTTQPIYPLMKCLKTRLLWTLEWSFHVRRQGESFSPYPQCQHVDGCLLQALNLASFRLYGVIS